jgi:hypothetical protein
VFRQLRLRFQLNAGDMIFFRSRELLHENTKPKGERRSIVFTMDHNAFLSPGQRVMRKYYAHDYLNIAVDPMESDEEIEHINYPEEDPLMLEDFDIKPMWKKRKRQKVADDPKKAENGTYLFLIF